MHPMVNIALRAARSAGEIIIRASENADRISIENKGKNDFVTEVDRAAEAEIISQLKKAYPQHSFLGEESGLIEGEDGEHTWVIDPLDGTTNFIYGIPHYCISIACLKNGKIEHAVILDPVRDEEFTATRGNGAQLNGHRIRVTNRKVLDGALIATGIPFSSRQEQHIDAYLESMKEICKVSSGIRRGGSAALDLAYVAAGRVDGYWEIGLQKWDIAAGTLLVQEAGGLISDFNGEFNYLNNGNIVCGNAKVFKALLQVVKPALGHIK